MRGFEMVYKIAATLIANLAIFASIGFALDKWLHTGKFFLVTLVILSFFTGLYACYRQIMSSDQS